MFTVTYYSKIRRKLLFEFSRGYIFTGEVDKFVTFWCEIFSAFCLPKFLKPLYFLLSYSTNRKGEVFVDHSV